MEFFRVYGRVIGLLRAERQLAIALALANVVVAGLQFYEPVLFGRVVDLLSTARERSTEALWHDARNLLILWAAVGLGGIVANIIVSLQADRMAHRRRLGAMALYFEHVLALPFAFHTAQHSGRLLKIMLTGVDHLFGIWLSFFRENLATFVALFVMLPLSLFLNWRMGALLIVLILFFAVANAWVVSKTEKLQGEVEEFHSQLAGRAGDALGNIHLIQSFVRLAAEAGEIHRIIRETLAAQFPVLNWWALLSVLTRAASTITVILIFVLGTWLYTQGQASVGEIVSFMGFAALLIGRMDQASSFVSRIFFQMPALADFFRVLDHQTTVPDRPNAIDIGRASGDVDFDDVSFSYDGKRPALIHFSLHVPAGTTVALVGPTGAGKSTTSCSCTACGTRSPAPSASTAGTTATSSSSRCDATSAWCSRTRPCSTARSATICVSASPTRRRPKSSRRPGWPKRTTSSCASRRVTRRWSASAAPPCRVASASGSPSPAHCSRIRRS
jgi:ATP-binding cassette subfamily B protein